MHCESDDVAVNANREESIFDPRITDARNGTEFEAAPSLEDPMQVDDDTVQSFLVKTLPLVTPASPTTVAVRSPVTRAPITDAIDAINPSIGAAVTTTTNLHNNNTIRALSPHPFTKWVDYLPSLPQSSHEATVTTLTTPARQHTTASATVKRVSLDATESHLHDNNNTTHGCHHHDDEDLHEMQLDVWDDAAASEITSTSDEFYNPLVPHSLLLSHDVQLQHELLLDDATSISSQSLHTPLPPTSGGRTQAETPHHAEDLRMRRQSLAASMQASQQSRKVLLSAHVQQRANLARVLSSIEKSSRQIQTGILTTDASSEHDGHYPSSTTTTLPDNDEDVVLEDDAVLCFPVEELLNDPMV
jgi:hypothetical protein